MTVKFADFDRKMRSYEQSLDQYITPEKYIAARLDGRSFTRLTKKDNDFEKPFDPRFHEIMVHTAKSLMNCGFNVVYAYTGSDEISLLFHHDESAFGRNVRKMSTLLAGEASAAFSLKLGSPAVFDCRLIPLPDKKRTADYFRWRCEDIGRNALDAWCYWTLLKDGFSERAASDMLSGKDHIFKRELLADKNIIYDDLPAWQRLGTGFYRKSYVKQGFDPVADIVTSAERHCIYTDNELPHGEAYADMIIGLIEASE